MRLTRLLVAAAAGTALAVTPFAAHADTYSHADAAGDVQVKGFDDDPSAFVTDPSRVLGDVVGSRVSHFPRTVKATVRVRELTRTGRGALTWYAVRTPDRLRWVLVDTTRGRWAGRVAMNTADFRFVPCSIDHKVDYVNNTVQVVIPRSCLGNPKWVRVGLGMETYGATRQWSDDGRVTADVTRAGTYGPRIYR